MTHDYSEIVIELKQKIREIENLGNLGKFAEAEGVAHEVQHLSFRLACWFWKEAVDVQCK